MVNQPECERSQERSPEQSISAKERSPEQSILAKEKDSDPEADDGCLCKRWCSPRREDLLTIKKLKDLVSTYFDPNSKRKLGAQGNAFHIIKLMKSLMEDVGRKWEE